MKAERVKPKREFVPVVVTLESQEEVDSLYVLCNHFTITGAFPALDGWWSKLTAFKSSEHGKLWNKLITIIR